MSDLLYEQLNNMLTIHYNTNDIVITRKIGSGGYSKVMGGNYKSLPVAIKKLKEFDINKFMKEIMIIKNFKHPKVPNFYGICKDAKRDSMRLITELIAGENFDTYVKNNNCSIIEIITYFIELAKILEYFHSYKFIHRDIKPSNIMIDNNIGVRLLDFGISKITNNSHTTTITSGTTIYMAPDNFQIKDNCTEEETRCSITTKVDVWAFGCILSEIFSKEKPWKRERDQHQVIAHLFNKSKFIIPEEKISNKEVISLIENCTNVEPVKRVTIKEAKDKLMEILFIDLYNGLRGDRNFIEILLKNLNSKKKYLILIKIYENLKYYHSSLLLTKEKQKSKKSNSLVNKEAFLQENTERINLDIIEKKIKQNISITGVVEILPKSKMHFKSIKLELNSKKENEVNVVSHKVQERNLSAKSNLYKKFVENKLKKQSLRPLTTFETKYNSKNNIVLLENQFKKILPKMNIIQKKKEEISLESRPILKGSKIHVVQTKQIILKNENSAISLNKIKNAIENNKKVSTAPSKEFLTKLHNNIKPIHKININKENNYEKIFRESKSNEKYRNKIYNYSKDKENNLILPRIENNNDWIKLKMNNFSKKQSNDLFKMDFSKINSTLNSNFLNTNNKKNEPKIFKKQTR